MNNLETLKRTFQSLSPEQHWGEEEFFYAWLYSQASERKENYFDFLVEKKYSLFLKELNDFDNLVKSFYEDWKKGEPFKPMWLEINKKRKEMLVLLDKIKD